MKQGQNDKHFASHEIQKEGTKLASDSQVTAGEEHQSKARLQQWCVLQPGQRVTERSHEHEGSCAKTNCQIGNLSCNGGAVMKQDDALTWEQTC